MSFKSANKKYCNIFKNIKFWKTLCLILIIIAILFGIESVGYFYVAEYAGKAYGKQNTLNIQTYFDKKIPWMTWLYPFYILWPFSWFIILPVACYLLNGKTGFWKYCVVSCLMYFAGIIIYAIFPTTCSPAEFIPGGQLYDNGTNKSWDWAMNGAFHKQLQDLAGNENNIWGSAPSYHNFWASILFFFGISSAKKWWGKTISITLGVVLSISTLTLHQHNIFDVIMTYSMTLFFMWLTSKYELDNKLSKISLKIFHI